MKLAFCLFNYFPYGGLQRDFYRIANRCIQRGHEVHVYTMHWEGQLLPGAEIHIVNTKGWQNYRRIISYIQQVKQHLNQQQPDVVIGFNKMPYLDIYYAADVCFQDRVKQKNRFLDQWLPRYKHYIANEAAVFAAKQNTHILLIAAKQQSVYSLYYQTEAERFHLLPPGISRDRLAPANAQSIRDRVRENNHLTADDHLLLLVGSGFKTKGLDRAIRGIAALPGHLKKTVKLFVIGRDNPNSFMGLAKQLQILDQVIFLGGRDDVRDFMLAADALVHPAYHENTGTVLLEALAAGLPVLTVSACGYANYVQEANAGIVLTEAFNQASYNAALQKILHHSNNKQWRDNALKFTQTADIFSLPEKAADFIDHIGQKRVFA